jgi:hypothetical protein
MGASSRVLLLPRCCSSCWPCCWPSWPDPLLCIFASCLGVVGGVAGRGAVYAAMGVTTASCVSTARLPVVPELLAGAWPLVAGTSSSNLRRFESGISTLATVVGQQGDTRALSEPAVEQKQLVVTRVSNDAASGPMSPLTVSVSFERIPF